MTGADQPAPSAEQRVAHGVGPSWWSSNGPMDDLNRTIDDLKAEVSRLTAERDVAWADVVAAQQREQRAYRKRGTALALLRAARTDRDAARAELVALREAAIDQEAAFRLPCTNTEQFVAKSAAIGRATHALRVLLAAPATPGQEGGAG